MNGSSGTLALAAIAGVAFSLMGISYRISQVRKISLQQILLVVAVCGSIYFAVMGRATVWGQVPPRVWVLGLAAGVSQYLTVRLVEWSLNAGPFSPVWCTVSLNFVPVTLYTTFFLHQPLAATQEASLVAAVACIVIASSGQPSAPQRLDYRIWRMLRYGLLLVSLLMVNGLLNVAMKDLGARSSGHGTEMQAFQNVFSLLLYGAMAIGLAMDLAVAPPRSPGKWSWLGPGLLAGFGSIAGVSLLNICSSHAGTMPFAINSVSMILSASVISATLMGEKLSVRWGMTVACGVAAIVLAFARDISIHG